MSAQIEFVAHRGGAALAPESTLVAYRNALRYPVDAVEIDVRMSTDGQPFVFHDHTLERTTDGTGNVADLDFAAARSLNLAAKFPGGWPQPEQLTTPREVLELMKGRGRVYVELKNAKRGDSDEHYPGIVESVLEDLRATDMLSNVLIICFDWSLLQEIKNLEPNIQMGALISKNMWDMLPQPLATVTKLISDLGCQYLNIEHSIFTPDMPAFLHQHDLKLGVWTVNKLEELRYYAAAGVDSLTTDHPDFFALL
jgi:glycerophosphoryl diester phosphodiesterase